MVSYYLQRGGKLNVLKSGAPKNCAVALSDLPKLLQALVQNS